MTQEIKKNRLPYIGGAVSTIMVGIGVFVLGNVSGYEAKHLIAASLQGVNMLCNTIVLASATILALLLTLLGISSSAKSKLKNAHYKQVLIIAKLDTILFVAALILFQLFNIPITEADSVPIYWFPIIYWSTLIVSSILSGILVTVILMLYTTVTNIIRIVGIAEDDHPLIDVDSNKDDEVN